jgi:hypothetical protein
MFNWAYDLEHHAPGTLLATGLAALLGALGLFLLGWPWASPGRTRATLGWALGVGLGFAAGCLILKVELTWPPRIDRGRILLVLWPAAVLVECLAALPRMPRVLAWAARLALAGVAARVVLDRSCYLGIPDSPPDLVWTPLETLAWLGGLAAALAVVWVLLAVLTEVAPGRSVPLSLAVICAGAWPALIYEHYLTGSGMALSLAGALAGATAASLLLRRPEGAGAGVGLGLVGLFALLVAGRFFADLTTAHAALLLFAPLLGWIPELPGLRRLPAWQRGLCRVALVLIPVVITVVRAKRADEETGRPAPASAEEEVRLGPRGDFRLERGDARRAPKGNPRHSLCRPSACLGRGRRFRADRDLHRRRGDQGPQESRRLLLLAQVPGR